MREDFHRGNCSKDRRVRINSSQSSLRSFGLRSLRRVLRVLDRADLPFYYRNRFPEGHE